MGLYYQYTLQYMLQNATATYFAKLSRTSEISKFAEFHTTTGRVGIVRSCQMVQVLGYPTLKCQPCQNAAASIPSTLTLLLEQFPRKQKFVKARISKIMKV